MRCPQCQAELASAVRHKVPVQRCPSCQGLWLTGQELEQLEDEVFDFGEHAKGTLVFESAPSAQACPQCAAPLRAFRYRLYQLPMQYCAQGHGFWLAAGEDDRVLELMRREEKELKNKLAAEDRWSAMLRQMRSRSFVEKLKDLFR
jgi:Zn-finger nucleic acid-binding protein